MSRPSIITIVSLVLLTGNFDVQSTEHLCDDHCVFFQNVCCGRAQYVESLRIVISDNTSTDIEKEIATAQMAILTEKAGEASLIIEKALRRFPDSIVLSNYCARSRARAGDLRSAISLCEECVASGKANTDTKLLLGLLTTSMPDGLEAIADRDSTAWLVAAQIFAAKKEYESVLSTLDKYELKVKSASGPLLMEEVPHYLRGIVLSNTGKEPCRAATELEVALNLEPERLTREPELALVIATCYFNCHKFKQSIQWAEKALLDGPRKADAEMLLAACITSDSYRSEEKTKRAVDLLNNTRKQRMLDIEKRSAVQMMLAINYARLEKIAEAMVSFDELVRFKPEHSAITGNARSLFVARHMCSRPQLSPESLKFVLQTSDDAITCFDDLEFYYQISVIHCLIRCDKQLLARELLGKCRPKNEPERQEVVGLLALTKNESQTK